MAVDGDRKHLRRLAGPALPPEPGDVLDAGEDATRRALGDAQRDRPIRLRVDAVGDIALDDVEFQPLAQVLLGAQRDLQRVIGLVHVDGVDVGLVVDALAADGGERGGELLGAEGDLAADRRALG